MPRTPDPRLASTFVATSHTTAPPTLCPSTNPLRTPLNVLILGASRGIGAGIARAYARAGCGTLILAARAASSEQVHAVAREAVELSKGAATVHCESVDVANAASVCALAERVRALCALDVVVLNAGYSGPVVLRVGEGAPGDFADVLAVNVQATYLVAHYFVPVLLDAGGARALVVVNSLASCITAGPIANTAYCVSKFAQARLVEFVAEQYRAQGVVAVAVHPGAVLTEMADETTPESFRPHLVDSVDLCGAFCVWLTREKRAWLSGRLVSAKWDVDELLAKKTEVEEQDLLKFGFRVRDVAAVE